MTLFTIKMAFIGDMEMPAGCQKKKFIYATIKHQ